MPIHDWSRVPAGLFHHFHQLWAATISSALNAGLLPKGFYALIEQHAAGSFTDVITLQRGPTLGERIDPRGGIGVAQAPPKTRFVSQATDEDIYASKADRIAIYNPLGGRGHRSSRSCRRGTRTNRHAIRSFVEKTLELPQAGPSGPESSTSSRPARATRKGFTSSSGTSAWRNPLSSLPYKSLTLAAYTAGVAQEGIRRAGRRGGRSAGHAAFSSTPKPTSSRRWRRTYLATWNTCPVIVPRV